MGTTDVEKTDFVRMSGKGQLVVPQQVRDSANLSPGETFVAFSVKDGVLFRKVELPKVNADFDSLTKEIEAQFKKNKVTKKDLNEAVKWAKKK